MASKSLVPRWCGDGDTSNKHRYWLTIY